MAKLVPTTFHKNIGTRARDDAGSRIKK